MKPFLYRIFVFSIRVSLLNTEESRMKKILNTFLPKIIGFYFNTASLFAPKAIANKAFKLFCSPRKGRVLPIQLAFLEQAKAARLQIGNTTIQTYKWEGSGPTVLLMHGWESNSYRWQSVITQLQKEGYTIIAMDAPAHGNSSGALLHIPAYVVCAEKVIQTYQPTYLIGHSMGGMAMLYHQYKYPNPTITKMVSLGAPTELSDFIRQYKTILGLNKRMVNHLESHFITNFGFSFAEFSTSKFAKEISTKGLIIHDKLDEVVPIWCAEQLHKNWKNSTLIITKNLGHSLQQKEVTAKVVAFLNS